MIEKLKYFIDSTKQTLSIVGLIFLLIISTGCSVACIGSKDNMTHREARSTINISDDPYFDCFDIPNPPPCTPNTPYVNDTDMYWTIASNGGCILYNHTAKLISEEQVANSINQIKKNYDDSIRFEKNYYLIKDYNLSCKKIDYLIKNQPKEYAKMDAGSISGSMSGSYSGFLSNGHVSGSVSGQFYQWVQIDGLIYFNLTKRESWREFNNSSNTSYIFDVRDIPKECVSSHGSAPDYIMICDKYIDDSHLYGDFVNVNGSHVLYLKYSTVSTYKNELFTMNDFIKTYVEECADKQNITWIKVN